MSKIADFLRFSWKVIVASFAYPQSTSRISKDGRRVTHDPPPTEGDRE